MGCVCCFRTLALGTGTESRRDLKQTRGAHALGHTHGAHYVLGSPTFSLDQGMPDHARTTHAKRVAYGNGATVHVQDVIGNA